MSLTAALYAATPVLAANFKNMLPHTPCSIHTWRATNAAPSVYKWFHTLTPLVPSGARSSVTFSTIAKRGDPDVLWWTARIWSVTCKNPLACRDVAGFDGSSTTPSPGGIVGWSAQTPVSLSIVKAAPG